MKTLGRAGLVIGAQCEATAEAVHSAAHRGRVVRCDRAARQETVMLPKVVWLEGKAWRLRPGPYPGSHPTLSPVPQPARRKRAR